MSWFNKKQKTYENGMWLNEQEWRDQVICQLVYLRNAIYFVGFVIAATQLAPWLKMLGLDELAVFTVFVVIALSAVSAYWFSSSAANSLEKRSENTTYREKT
jgi:NADH:ubiquinone oxidoreductase subunit 3 (subunit A)